MHSSPPHTHTHTGGQAPMKKRTRKDSEKDPAISRSPRVGSIGMMAAQQVTPQPQQQRGGTRRSSQFGGAPLFGVPCESCQGLQAKLERGKKDMKLKLKRLELELKRSRQTNTICLIASFFARHGFFLSQLPQDSQFMEDMRALQGLTLGEDDDDFMHVNEAINDTTWLFKPSAKDAAGLNLARHPELYLPIYLVVIAARFKLPPFDVDGSHGNSSYLVDRKQFGWYVVNLPWVGNFLLDKAGVETEDEYIEGEHYLQLCEYFNSFKPLQFKAVKEAAIAYFAMKKQEDQEDRRVEEKGALVVHDKGSDVDGDDGEVTGEL